METEEAGGWSKPQLLKISDLQMPKCFYPRERVNQLVVAKYSGQLLAGAKFPPIKVGILHNHWVIVDGWHRTSAYTKIRVKYITGVVKEYSSEKDLFADAVRFNQDHGYSLNLSDRRRSIKILKRFKFTVEDITCLTSMSARDVTRSFDKKKSEMLTITGPGGKRIMMPFMRSATEDMRLRITDAIGLSGADEVYETIAVHVANGKCVTVPIVSSTDDMQLLIEEALKLSRGNGMPELAMVLERALSLLSGSIGNGGTILKYGSQN